MPLEQLVRTGSARPIRRWADPLLHERAREVVEFDDDLQLLLADMFATNTAAGGAGLAAPQVGVGLAAFVYDCLDADVERRVGVVCNPVVEVDSGATRRLETWEEGCLSLPGAYAELARPAVAVCRGQDQYGEPVELRGTGLLARCFQHETDHLDGIVSGDRLPSRRAAASRRATRPRRAATPSAGPPATTTASPEDSHSRTRVGRCDGHRTDRDDIGTRIGCSAARDTA